MSREEYEAVKAVSDYLFVQAKAMETKYEIGIVSLSEFRFWSWSSNNAWGKYLKAKKEFGIIYE
jgi:hypothetical protein